MKVTRTYNSNHLLIGEKTELVAGSVRGVVGDTTIGYTGQADPGRPLDRSQLVANWSQPATVTHTVHNPQTGQEKTSTVTTGYDAYGRTVSRDDGTTTTTTVYGGYGLPTKVTVTGVDGLISEQTNVLTADGKQIAQTVTTQTPTGGGVGEETSRTVYEYGNAHPMLAASATTTTGVGTDGATRSERVESVLPGDGTVVSTLTDPAGVATVHTLDIATGLTVSEVDAAGRTVAYDYDVAGRLVAVTAPDGTTTETVYGMRAVGDPVNTVATVRSDGYVVRTVYDVAGREIAAQDNYTPPAAADTGPDLSVAGIADVDPLTGVETAGWRTLSRQAYNERGLVAAQTDRAGRVTTTDYDASSMPVGVSAPDGTVTTTYDAVAGTQTQTLTPTGSNQSISTTTRIDVRGNATESRTDFTDGTPSVAATTVYDSLDRPTRHTATGTGTLDTTYPGFGAPTTTLASAAGDTATPLVTATSVTGFGQPIQKTLAQEGAAATPARTLGYDTAGRQTSETDQLGAVWSTHYDRTDGAPTSLTRPDGTTLHTLRDGAGRVEHTFLTHPGGNPDTPADRSNWVQSEYHPVTGALISQFDPGDRAGTEIRHRYYPDGAPHQTIYPDGATLTWTWTVAGELQTFTDVAGVITTYAYHPATGRLTSASNHTEDGGTVATVEYEYTEFGQPKTIVRGNGARTTYAYDQSGRVTEETHTDGSGDRVTTIEYGHDVAGNLLWQATVTGPGHPHGETVTLATHEYDHLNRLVATHTYPDITSIENLPDGHPATQTVTYRYDLASQLTGSTHVHQPGTDQAVETVTEYHLDATGKPTTITRNATPSPTRRYDANGNLLDTGEGTTHTYTPTGRPHTTTTVHPDPTVPADTTTPNPQTGPVTVTHHYWVDGTLRTETTQTGDQEPVTLTTYWDTTAPIPTLINQRDTDGTTSSYLFGLTREHRTLTRNGTPSNEQTGGGYYHTNPQSSILALTDQTGTTTHTYRYDDYGTPINEQTDATTATGIHRNPHTYTGAYTTPTGHYQLGARFYDSTTKTFTTRDTAPTLARYHYAAANPHTHTDPTGQTPTAQQWVGWGLGIASIIGGIILMIATTGIATPAVIAAIGVEIFLGVTATVLETVSIFGQENGYIDEQLAQNLGWAGLGIGIAATLATGITGALAKAAARTTALTGQATHTATTPPAPLLTIEQTNTSLLQKHLDELARAAEIRKAHAESELRSLDEWAFKVDRGEIWGLASQKFRTQFHKVKDLVWYDPTGWVSKDIVRKSTGEEVKGLWAALRKEPYNLPFEIAGQIHRWAEYGVLNVPVGKQAILRFKMIAREVPDEEIRLLTSRRNPSGRTVGDQWDEVVRARDKLEKALLHADTPD